MELTMNIVTGEWRRDRPAPCRIHPSKGGPAPISVGLNGTL
jgi:hypothetical protein